LRGVSANRANHFEVTCRSPAYLIAGFVLGLGWLLAPPAHADRLDEIRARGVIRVGTTGDYKPFSYRTNESSPWIGLDIELAQQLAKVIGVRVEWVATTWPALMPDFNENRFDIAMSGVSISAERQRVAFFSVPYLRDGKTPITRCEDVARFQTIAQIDQPGVRVVVNPGGTNERFARANIMRATITVWPDNITIFDRIVAGEADVMLTDAIETRLQQRLRPQLCAVHPDAPFDLSEKAYLLPRDEQWKREVDGWLSTIVANGELTRLLEKWLAHPWPRAAPDAIEVAPLCQLMAERLSIMQDVARYKWNQRAAIDDPARERQIIDGLKRDAETVGVSARWAELFFRAQIEAAKLIQRDLFARWEREGQGTFADAPDLVSITRPKLDALTPQLLRELAMAWPALTDPGQQRRIAATVQRVKWDPADHARAAALAAAPLTDGSAARR
jgi:chorismate mutase-like protein